MSIQLTIGSDDWSNRIELNQPPRFTTQINGRGTATFMLVIKEGESRAIPVSGQIATLYDDGSVVFRGSIDIIEKHWYGVRVDYHLLITLASMEQRLDIHMVTPRSYTGQTAGAIFTDLFNSFAGAETITVGDVQAGVTIASLIYDQIPLTQAMDDLATTAGFSWGIDVATNAIYFRPSTSPAAPFTLSSSKVLWDTIDLTFNRQDFRTRQKIRINADSLPASTAYIVGDGTTNIWATIRPIASIISITPLAGANVATAVGTFTGLPSDGDTITIGTTVYTFKTAIDNTIPFQVKIGADANSTALHLQHAVNDERGGAEGSEYSLPTWEHPTVNITGTSSGHFSANSKTPSAAANAIATTESAANFSWSAATLTGGLDGTYGSALRVGVPATPDTDWRFVPGTTEVYSAIAPLDIGAAVLVLYRASGADVLTVQNDAVIAATAAIEGSSGIYENLIQSSGSDPAASDPLSAIARANGALTAYGAIAKLLLFTTREYGLVVSQLLTFGLAAPFASLNGNWLIQQIDANYVPNELHFRYAVQAVSGGRLGTSLDFWLQLAGVSGGGGGFGAIPDVSPPVNPLGSTDIGYVTGFAAGTPTIFTQLVAGEPSVSLAQFNLSYNAPTPLGTGPTTFSGVHYWVFDGTKLISLGSYAFTGAAGDPHSDLNIGALPWPAAAEPWDIYALSRSVGAGENSLILKGDPNATPHVTITVGGPLTPPLVAIFQIGHEDANGSWTDTMYWDILNKEMRIDWAATLPPGLNNYGGMAVWIYNPSAPIGFQYGQATGILTAADFEVSNETGVLFHHDTITIEPDSVPDPVQTWTFIAVSYDTSSPQIPNTDLLGNVTGPSLTLKTLLPANIPNFNPPGKVTNANWTIGSDATPNLMDLVVTYTPPVVTATQGPFQGVALYLNETGPGIHPGGIGERRIAPQYLGSFDADETAGEQSISLQHAAATAAGQTWGIIYRPYGPNQSGADSTIGLTANDVLVTHMDGTISQGARYELQYSGAAQIAPGVTAAVFPTYDESGAPRYGFVGTFPVPVDPLFAYCMVVGIWDGTTAEIDLAQPGAEGSFDTDTWASYPDVDTGIRIYFYAVNQMGTVNRELAPSVHLVVARPVGPLGQEWAHNIPFITGVGATPTAVVVTDLDDVGAQRWWLSCTWTIPPALTLNPPAVAQTVTLPYRGLKIFAWPGGALSNRIELFTADAHDTACTTKKLPMPAAPVPYRIHFVSMDGNGRMNSMNTGIVPPTPYVDVTVAPSVQGTLNLTRALLSKLDPSLGMIGDKFGVPDNTIKIQKFADGIRPIAVFGNAFPPLPDSLYPAGTMGVLISTSPPTKKVVSSNGTTWEPAINGTTDVVANSIGANQIDVISLSAAFATITYLQAGYATLFSVQVANARIDTLVANSATIGQLNAITITADRITGGIITAAIQLNAATILSGSISGTTVVLVANGITTSLNNSIWSGTQSYTLGLQVADGGAFIGIGPHNLLLWCIGFQGSVANLAITGIPFVALNPLRAYLYLNDVSGAHSINLDPDYYPGFGSTLFPVIKMDGLVVLTSRRNGPGNPSFASLADAQTWCSNMNSALQAHGLIT